MNLVHLSLVLSISGFIVGVIIAMILYRLRNRHIKDLKDQAEMLNKTKRIYK